MCLYHLFMCVDTWPPGLAGRGVEAQYLWSRGQIGYDSGGEISRHDTSHMRRAHVCARRWNDDLAVRERGR